MSFRSMVMVWLCACGAAYAQPAAQDLGVLVNPTSIAPAAAVGPGEVKWYRFEIPAVAAPAYLDMTTSATGVLDTEMGLYHAQGNLVGNDDDDGPANFSSLTFGARCATRANGNGLVHDGRDGAVLAAGVYYLAVGEFNLEFGATGWGVTSDSTGSGTITTTINLGTAPPVSPPGTAMDLGTLTEGTFASDTFTISAGLVNWYTFEVPQIQRGVNYLDIGTVGPVDVNTVMALYSEEGVRISFDDNDGPGSFSSLSYGEPCANRDNSAMGLAAGLPFDGRDATSLAPGRYYLAVSGSATTFTACFAASTAHTRTGEVTVRLAMDLPPPTGGMPPASFFDLGDISAGVQGLMVNNSPITGGQPRWFRFSTFETATNTPPSGATAHYFDIHTAGSVIGASNDGNDTFLALYSSNGSLVATDDDDCVLSSSQLSFGAVGPRGPVVIGEDPGLPLNGVDGTLPAGTYFLAVTVFSSTSVYPQCTFGIVDTSTANGSIDVTITTDLPDGQVCGTADFNGDGDTGTDADIEAFFACLGGMCCATCQTADFNDDGDTGTDADIEAFFRVLGGGEC